MTTWKSRVDRKCLRKYQRIVHVVCCVGMDSLLAGCSNLLMPASPKYFSLRQPGPCKQGLIDPGRVYGPCRGLSSIESRCSMENILSVILNSRVVKGRRMMIIYNTLAQP